MSEQPHDPAEITELARIALASAHAKDRELWWTLFALDTRLARIVATAREPILAQMRLSWWRDELAKPVEARPVGDPVLDEIGRRWRGGERALIALVDGWEHLLGEAPLESEAMSEFAKGRAAACEMIARLLQVPEASEKAAKAGERWALAELSSRCSDPRERTATLDLARSLEQQSSTLPRALRPLAVIDGLASRSLARGGALLVGDRLSPLVALRLGILGR